MLPGVECARRRRLHKSGGCVDSPSLSTHNNSTRRSSFCLYASNHESRLSSSSSSLLVCTLYYTHLFLQLLTTDFPFSFLFYACTCKLFIITVNGYVLIYFIFLWIWIETAKEHVIPDTPRWEYGRSSQRSQTEIGWQVQSTQGIRKQKVLFNKIN